MYDIMMELLKACGRMFLNPLTYWLVILFFASGILRINRERRDFGFKIFDITAEWKGTLLTSVIFSVITSIAMIGLGVAFSPDTVLILGIVVIILSLTGKFTLLSPTYTLGITFIILLFLPLLLEHQSELQLDKSFFSMSNFFGLAFLMGIFLFVESFLLRNIRRNESFAKLIKGRRGKRVGVHHLKKASIIPFFALIPSGLLEPIAPYWPYLSFGDGSYGLILIPFLIGFDFKVRGKWPEEISAELSSQIMVLASIVLFIVIASINFNGLSLVAILVGIIGREYILYKHRTEDTEHSYTPTDKLGLKVLAVMPNTPGDRIGMQIGNVLTHVNGVPLYGESEFYEALQTEEEVFEIEYLDDFENKNTSLGKIADDDHHALGLIFVPDTKGNAINEEKDEIESVDIVDESIKE